MKTRKISMLAVFGVVAGLSFESSAQSVGFYIDLAKKGADQFCSPIGEACNDKIVAALAVFMCYDNAKKKVSFRAGKCYGKAVGLLGAGVDTEKAKTILFEEAKKRLGGSEFNTIKGLVGK